MANRCTNLYWALCPTTEEANKLCKFLLGWYNTKKGYIDEIMKSVGIDPESIGNHRDYIDLEPYVKKGTTTVYFGTDSAWTPNPNTWQEICQKIIPECTLLYYAEEPGSGIFSSNNPDFYTKYYVDVYCEEAVWDANEGSGIYSEEDVVTLLQEALSTREENIDKLLSRAEETDFGEGNSLIVEPIIYMSLNEWDS